MNTKLTLSLSLIPISRSIFYQRWKMQRFLYILQVTLCTTWKRDGSSVTPERTKALAMLLIAWGLNPPSDISVASKHWYTKISHSIPLSFGTIQTKQNKYTWQGISISHMIISCFFELLIICIVTCATTERKPKSECLWLSKSRIETPSVSPPLPVNRAYALAILLTAWVTSG